MSRRARSCWPITRRSPSRQASRASRRSARGREPSRARDPCTALLATSLASLCADCDDHRDRPAPADITMAPSGSVALAWDGQRVEGVTAVYCQIARMSKKADALLGSTDAVRAEVQQMLSYRRANAVARCRNRFSFTVELLFTNHPCSYSSRLSQEHGPGPPAGRRPVGGERHPSAPHLALRQRPHRRRFRPLRHRPPGRQGTYRAPGATGRGREHVTTCCNVLLQESQ